MADPRFPPLSVFVSKESKMTSLLSSLDFQSSNDISDKILDKRLPTLYNNSA